jgi:exopolyphosphatase/pppGpp-phosphohydrolase
MLLGALDLGSNSFHLLVARLNRRGRFEKVVGRKATLRLEQAVAASGRIPPEIFARALDAVGELLAVAREYGATDVVVAGTSALREAENGTAFGLAVRARFGVGVEILSGEDEGRLVYDGARSWMSEQPARARGFGLAVAVLATLCEAFGAPAARVTPGGLREGLLLREIGGNSTRHARVHLHDAGRFARPPAG